MNADSKIPNALDEFLARLRADLDAHGAAFTATVLEHNQQGEEAWRARIDEAAARFAEERRDLERRLTEQRAEHDQAEARFAEERQDLERQLAEQRAEHDQAATRFAEERRDLEGRLAEQRAEHDQTVARFAEQRQDLEHQLADQSAEHETVVAALQASRPDTRGETLAQTLGAVRQLDESPTLSGILEALAKGAVDAAPRVALLLIERDGFKVWGHFGFPEGQGPADLSAGHAAPLGTTGMTRETSIIRTGDAAVADLPAFMQPSDGEAGLIAPLVVGGEVVGVVYAAAAAPQSDREQMPAWAEQVELLVRHAAARLENVTSARTVASLTRSA